jgi:hypothetical protein
MEIRIEASHLPGTGHPEGDDLPEGRVHVAVQGRRGQQDLLGLTPGDAAAARWELEATVASPSPGADLRGPQIHGRPGERFLYLSWGVVGADGAFTMFRRAKLQLNAVPDTVLSAAISNGRLTGRLGLTDERGGPRCASVRPPLISWSAG